MPDAGGEGGLRLVLAPQQVADGVLELGPRPRDALGAPRANLPDQGRQARGRVVVVVVVGDRDMRR